MTKPEVLVIPASDVRVGDEIVTWGFVAAVEPHPEDERVGLIVSDDGTLLTRQMRTNVRADEELAVLRGKKPRDAEDLAEFILGWLREEGNQPGWGTYVADDEMLTDTRIDGEVDLLGLAAAIIKRDRDAGS